jgi:hypothetical protein
MKRGANMKESKAADESTDNSTNNQPLGSGAMFQNPGRRNYT